MPNMTQGPMADSGTGAPGSKFELNPGDIVIAVMGITGVGKSTFISHFTDEDVPVGRELTSCTASVDIYKCSTSEHPVFYLVDTPGFDDTTKTDTDILMELAGWLSAAYTNRILLTGIVYLHRITDVRLQGSAMQNLRMFRRLCGTEFFPKVVLATTFWSAVSQTVGQHRETELKDKADFWGSMIGNGSKVFRQDRRRESAKLIINHLIAKRVHGQRDVRTELQKQMVDENKTLDQTAAGIEIQSQLTKQKREYEDKLDDMRREMRAAMDKQDEELQKMLHEQRENMKKKIKQVGLDNQKLNADKDETIRRLDEQLRKDRERGEEHKEKLELQQVMWNYQLETMQEKHKSWEQQEELKRQIEAGKLERNLLRWKMAHDYRCSVM